MKATCRFILVLMFVSVVALGAGCAAARGVARVRPAGEQLYAQFREPPVEYRGKPFWAWNGELKKDELIRQIRVMKEMGFGGFFMHSRTGLATEYLGDEWFSLVNACADEAEISRRWPCLGGRRAVFYGRSDRSPA